MPQSMMYYANTNGTQGGGSTNFLTRRNIATYGFREFFDRTVSNGQGSNTFGAPPSVTMGFSMTQTTQTLTTTNGGTLVPLWTNQPIGGAFFNGHYEVLPTNGDESAWSYTFASAQKTFYSDVWTCRTVSGVHSWGIDLNSPTAFPAQPSPGPDWVFLYGIVHESDDVTNAAGSYARATGTLNSYTFEQGSPNDFDLSTSGQVILGYEVSTAQGVMPVRTPTVNPTPGRSYALFTIVLETNGVTV